MAFDWWKLRSAPPEPFPSEWEAVLTRLPFFAALDDEERQRLRSIVRVLVKKKNWEGCGGLVLTPHMQVVISAQAARLLLHIDHDHFRNASSILVYPSGYVNSFPRRDASGVSTEGTPLLGEAWGQGPVVLSWDVVENESTDSLSGRNLVLHEFAHKLDQVDGYADGTPPLAGRAAYRIWSAIMGKEYDRLVEQTRTGRHSVLDEYGATDRAEFFAVATECFFEKGAAMKAQRPALYDLFRRYYAQDPAARAGSA